VAFPRVGLLPDKYMLVFARARTAPNDLVYLHTNFRLNKQGGYLALIGPTTNIVSEFAPKYPKQAAIFLWSYPSRTSPGCLCCIEPGSPNPVSDPVSLRSGILTPGGNFTAPFNLELSSLSSKCIVRYTLDGTLRSALAFYSVPLRITNSTYIRARSTRRIISGHPHSDAYVKLSSNALEFSSSLPRWSWIPSARASCFFARLFRAPYRHSGQWQGTLASPPTLSTRAGFRVARFDFIRLSAIPFAVKFVDDFNEEQHLSPVGLPADSDWVLYAPNAYDPVMIHNPFVHQLSRDIGRYSPAPVCGGFCGANNGPLMESDYNGITC